MNTHSSGADANDRIVRPLRKEISNHGIQKRSLGTATDLSGRYAESMQIVGELSNKFKRSKTSIIKSIMQNPCECRARFEIENATQNIDRKFDSYFSSKHELVKNKFVQKLTLALRRCGIGVCIATEEKTQTGICDVMIYDNNYAISINHNKLGKTIVLEFKTGNAFDLYQVERYLWECDLLIILRIAVNQVICVRRGDVERYLAISLSDLKERAAIICTSKDLQKIPGRYCRDCPVHSCEHYKPGKKLNLFAYSSESMEKDVITIFSNMYSCIDDAVRIILKELSVDESE